MPFKPDFLDDFIRLEIEGRTFELFMKKSGILNGLCGGALNSTDMLDELKNYDLIIYYGGIYCAPLVGEFLDIPRVEIFPYPPNILLNAYHMTPMPVSYVPRLIKPDLTDKMTFGERVINLVAYLGSRLVLSLVLDRSMNNLKIKFNIKPERSFQEAVGDAEMVIITADFALEYPLPLLPGIQVVFWELKQSRRLFARTIFSALKHCCGIVLQRCVALLRCVSSRVNITFMSKTTALHVQLLKN